jgi:flagellar motor protein MotB
MAAKRTRKRFVDIPVIDLVTVLFASLNTLLLAFFIALNANATVDPARARLVIGSLIGSFGGVPGATPQVRTEGMLSSPNARSGDEITGVRRSLSELLAEHNLQGTISVFVRGDDLVFSFEGSALFAEDSDELLAGAREVLAGLLDLIGHSERQLTVEGHTDTITFSGTRFATPWLYAAARATRVSQALGELGVAPERLIAASAGCARPQYPDELAEQQSLNRHIDVVVEDGANDPLVTPPSRTVTIGEIEVELPPGAPGRP